MQYSQFDWLKATTHQQISWFSPHNPHECRCTCWIFSWDIVISTRIFHHISHYNHLLYKTSCMVVWNAKTCATIKRRMKPSWHTTTVYLLTDCPSFYISIWTHFKLSTGQKQHQTHLPFLAGFNINIYPTAPKISSFQLKRHLTI